MRPRIDPRVAGFLDDLPRDTLFVPSLVVAELRYGLRRLPTGQRRDKLERDLETFLATGFGNRILAFDAACADGYATARAERQRLGRPIAALDALIGGMALACNATRNTQDFDGYGLTLIDPWQIP